MTMAQQLALLVVICLLAPQGEVLAARFDDAGQQQQQQQQQRTTGSLRRHVAQVDQESEHPPVLNALKVTRSDGTSSFGESFKTDAKDTGASAAALAARKKAFDSAYPDTMSISDLPNQTQYHGKQSINADWRGEYPLGNSSNETSMFGMGGAKPSAATSPIGLAVVFLASLVITSLS